MLSCVLESHNITGAFVNQQPNRIDEELQEIRLKQALIITHLSYILKSFFFSLLRVLFSDQLLKACIFN
jgi:hypothetical protein